MSSPSAEYSHRVVAIDGPAASGKSTVSRSLARRLGFVYVNSGAMYRAVTWAVLEAGIDPGDARAVAAGVAGLDVRCSVDTDADGREQSIITVDGVDPGDALRADRVNAAVSPVSSVPEVREILVRLQREYANASDIVMEGRDIGSVVFADTPYKVFLDASEEVRQSRREAEGLNDPIADRDRQDSSRKTAPLVVPDDAVVVDTSRMTLEEVVDRVESLLRSRGLAPNT